MTKPNFGAGRASDLLLRASGNSSVLYPGKGGGSRELRRAAERQAKKEAKQSSKK